MLSLATLFHDFDYEAVVFEPQRAKYPVKVVCFNQFLNLVVKILCLVVKIGHLVVIFERLVVKILCLVVIVK